METFLIGCLVAGGVIVLMGGLLYAGFKNRKSNCCNDAINCNNEHDEKKDDGDS